MDSEVLAQVLFGVIGGLGIFLMGMQNMSEGMQAVAGTALRRIISAVTRNRLLAAGVGVLVTCLVQSSSITTVMVIGFVNSGLMMLSQAIGVIMGANIGTTITGWILVLKIGKYGLPILGVAAFVYLFSKRDRPRYIAMTFMGMGMVFFGLELMKDACSCIKELPQFEVWLGRFRADNYLGILQCMATGCVLTVLVQSSSATLGITIALTLTGAIPYETAAALVLGENIGTTITALLASIGATTNARRAAYFHVLFNMLGVTWITLIFFQYVRFVPWLMDADVTRMVLVNGKETFPQTTAVIAATHSIFNITNTILFLPFVQHFSRMLERAVPAKADKEQPRLTSLDVRMLETPVIAIEQSRIEILRMANRCHNMMYWLKQLLSTEEPDPKCVRKLFHQEEILDTSQDEVVMFITALLSASVPQSTIEEGRRQLRLADEYESVSDYIASILKFHLKLLKQGHGFEEKQRADLLKLHDMVDEYLTLVTQGYEQHDAEILTRTDSVGAAVRQRVKQLHNEHLIELSQATIQPYVSVAYTATLNSYRRVRDHALNIAETLGKPREAGHSPAASSGRPDVGRAEAETEFEAVPATRHDEKAGDPPDVLSSTCKVV